MDSTNLQPPGDYPDDWLRLSFDNFTTLKRGKDITRDQFHDGRVPVAGSNGRMGFHDTANVKAPGITVGRSGSVGRVTFYSEDFWAHNTALYVTDFHGNDARFAAYFLESLKLNRFGSGVSVPTLDRNVFRALPVTIPPLPEQRKIAGVLGVVQRAMEQQERLVALTAELKKALLHKLFTEGLRGEPQKQTNLGPVPESWEVRRLGDYARVVNGYAFKSDDYVEVGVRLIRISNVGVGTLMAKDDKYLPQAYLAEKAEYALEEGDLILALTRPIIAGGIKFCFVRRSDLPALLNQRVGKFQVMSPKLLKDYLSHVLFSDYFTKPLKTMAEGSNQPNISPTRLENFLIPIPSDLKEQGEIAEVLTNLTKKTEIARRKHAILTNLFRTMLHQLMMAQIRVHDLDLEGLLAQTVAEMDSKS